MWLLRAKRLFKAQVIPDDHMSADDRFDQKLQELVLAQQHLNLFVVRMV